MSRWRLWMLCAVSALVLLLMAGWPGSSTAFAEEPLPSPSSSEPTGSESPSVPSSEPSSSEEPSAGPSSPAEPSPSPTAAVVFVEPGPELMVWVQGVSVAVVLLVALTALHVVGSWGR